MVVTVVIVALAVGMVLVSGAAIGAILWMRSREQKRDEVLQSAEALATLDEALDDALKELNKVGNLVQKEIGEKYQAMLFLYNLLKEKQKAQSAQPVQTAIPEKIAADIARAEADVTAAEVVPLRVATTTAGAPATRASRVERAPVAAVSSPTVVEVPDLDEPVFAPAPSDNFDEAGEGEQDGAATQAAGNEYDTSAVYALPADEPAVYEAPAPTAVDAPTRADASPLRAAPDLVAAGLVAADEVSRGAVASVDEPDVAKIDAPTPAKKKKTTPTAKKADTVVSDGLLAGVTPAAGPAVAVSAKPAPRKRATNPKHQRVRELHDQGLNVADIAKELGIGKGEITLILEMSGKR